MSLLEVKDVSKSFPVESGIFRGTISTVTALERVSLSLERGKAVGVVGESGSGKTTLGKVICRLIAPDSGEVFVEGKNIRDYSRSDMAMTVQMVFQDPFASLNPKLTVGTMLNEALPGVEEGIRREEICETLSRVGLSDTILHEYPHQFSGGQRQRIALARALLKKPSLIVADEPLSALDVSIQNQLLSLFLDLKETLSVSFVFISHDLAAASIVSDHLVVMKQGRVVEEGSVDAVISDPHDPYTKNLISAVPRIQ